MANAHHSKEKYEQIAAKLRGRKRSEETRNKISKALMGHKVTPETLAKLRGRRRSPKFRKIMSEIAKKRIPWNKGKTGIYSPEVLQKIRERTREAMKRIKWTPEQRRKMGDAQRGRPRTPEEREKIRIGQYKRFEKEIPGYNYLDDGRRIRRKVRLRKNGGFHTKKEWEQLKALHNFTCLGCKKKEPEIRLTRDHITSVLNGGTDDITNIQPLCRSCNSKKHSN